MAISNIVQTPMVAYYEDERTCLNPSFIKMHYFLKAKGIKNNKFFLLIYDAGLMGVNPRDPNLPIQMRMRILRECCTNFWYFLRNCVTIAQEGGAAGTGVPYELHRGNLALNYMFVYNINTFLELPRQHGKTVSSLCWYLWVFNFGTTNSRIVFANKKHDDSKRNLITLKNIRDNLPEYLRMDKPPVGPDGKIIRFQNSNETTQNPINHNVISTLPGARTPSLADGAGRGLSVPLLYYDEFAFLPYNDIVYTAAAPAQSTASSHAKANGAPYGVLITTTPGDLTTREGQFAKKVRDNATEWNEKFYDLPYNELMDVINSNRDSNFMHIKYTYQMLGKGKAYFDNMVKDLQKDWLKIRREVMLEWANGSDNNPFDRTDLETIATQVREEPKYTLLFGKAKFQVKFWDSIPMGSTYPPIIGVDVSSGSYKDSSAITVIDSETTKVIATFRNNFITMPELADLIYQFVTNYCRNAIVCVENNGGFGSSVIQMLLKTSIKKNLYYEIKDRHDEEIINGITIKKPARKVKVYGATSNKAKRDDLISILHQRVQHHRDKFMTKEIYDELCTMVVKPNGKVEHADDAHDDLTFSYLWALYVFYRGEELPTRFHLLKREIYTDDHYDETSYSLEEEYNTEEKLSPTIFKEEESIDTKLIEDQMKIINRNKTIGLEDLYKRQLEDDERALEKIRQRPDGRQAIADHYHIPLESVEKEEKLGFNDHFSNDVMKLWYGTDDSMNQNKNKTSVGNLSDLFDRL